MKRQGIVRNATIALVSAFMMWSSTSCSSSNAASAAETSSVPEQSSSAPESASQAENSSETENTDKSTLKTVSLGYPGNNGCCDGLFGYIDVKGILEEELNKAGYTADSIGFSGGGAGIMPLCATPRPVRSPDPHSGLYGIARNVNSFAALRNLSEFASYAVQF